jgi:hypothetical protein
MPGLSPAASSRVYQLNNCFFGQKMECIMILHCGRDVSSPFLMKNNFLTSFRACHELRPVEFT